MKKLEEIVEVLKTEALNRPEIGWLSDLSHRGLEWDESNKAIVVGQHEGSVDIGHLAEVVQRLINEES